MAVRKQKDPKMVAAGKKAAATRRKNLGVKPQVAQTSSRVATPTKSEQEPVRTEAETKWHITAQSALTLKVDLPARERLPDFMDQPWVIKYRPISLNECIGSVVGYLKAFVKTGSFPLVIMLYGDYGDGKTSSAKAMVRDYFVMRGLFKRDATFMDMPLWIES